MPLLSKQDAAASFPIDTTTPFHPTKAIYINDPSEFSLTTTATDITTSVAHLLPSLDVQTTPTLLTTAKSTSPTLPVTLTFTRPNRLSRSWTASEPDSNTPIAELSNPLWSLGKWTITFPSPSSHSSHTIILHPASFASKTDEFVKDSVPYFWDMVEGRKLCKLYRAMEGKKVEVARFVGENVRAREGVLLVEDGKGVDWVVVMVTFLAVLMRVDSFRA
ncbi:3-phosphoshikimate 1-carboxyvinyltransferase [Podospora aff. communis PSN243]|uniref:3-phosphoshikimate 1-carboxyvinyltransferase n=1 Tax=Podospora aff. communis PSN243 TaxID=3040156 RepID=A0AAV9GA63_9PEZI|nr:3-phosphoshikimate 1-carboxyvinyltransferase [Podospora aff. communis PSN243]